MYIICSNFGSIQPESKVAVWSTSAKPAMCPTCGRHFSAQAGDGISMGSWDVKGKVGHEDEVAKLSQTEQQISVEPVVMLSPAQFKDIATGEPISNERCLHVCKELDRTQKIFQEGKHIYKRVMRETPGSQAEKRAAARQASGAHAGGDMTQIWTRLCQDKIVISLVATAPLLKTMMWHTAMRGGYSLQYINVTQA